MKDNKAIVKEAKWNVDVPKFKILGRNHLKTQVARAFLPNYFPNYKLYIWLDADVWLNDFETFLLYEIGALKNALGKMLNTLSVLKEKNPEHKKIPQLTHLVCQLYLKLGDEEKAKLFENSFNRSR